MLEALRRLLESLSGDAAAQLPKLGTLYSSFLENNEDSGVDLSETSSSSLSLLFVLFFFFSVILVFPFSVFTLKSLYLSLYICHQ